MSLSEKIKSWCDADFCTCANTAQGWAQDAAKLEAERDQLRKEIESANNHVSSANNAAQSWMEKSASLEAERDKLLLQFTKAYTEATEIAAERDKLKAEMAALLNDNSYVCRDASSCRDAMD